MPNLKINQTLLVTGTEFMSNEAPINTLMTEGLPFDKVLAAKQHANLVTAFRDAGINVIQKAPPAGCQDGVFPANHALVNGDKALLARLPNVRKAEEPYAKATLSELGKTVFKVPEQYKFSGQGDALMISPTEVIVGSNYRTDPEVHKLIEEILGLTVYGVQTLPELDAAGQPVINAVTGWPDSPWYDLDLSISVLRFPNQDRPGLIGWCPEAFTSDSKALVTSLPFDRIEVSRAEAHSVGACNLVSTGSHVIMNAGAPLYKAAIEAHGLSVEIVDVSELNKNGGGVRCSSLTL